jgi:YARHG domain
MSLTDVYLLLLDFPDSNTIVLLVGCFLLIVGVFGGGIEVKGFKIPALQMGPRLLSGILGLCFLALSLGFPAFLKSVLKNKNTGSTTTSGPSSVVPPQPQNPSPEQNKRNPKPGDGDSSTEGNALPFFMDREMTEADLQGKSPDQLREMRNEIYARHGRMFKDASVQSYFNNQPWYRPVYSPDKFPQSLLTSVQQKNIQMITESEHGNH